MKTTISNLFALALFTGCAGSDGPSDDLETRGVELLDVVHYEAFSKYLVDIDGAERRILSFHGPVPTTLVLDPAGEDSVLAVDSDEGVAYFHPSHPDELIDAPQPGEPSSVAFELCESGLLPEPASFRKAKGCYAFATACWNTCAGAGMYGSDTSACWAACTNGMNACE